MRSIAKKRALNSVSVTAQRFIQAFQNHGIEPAQIPRLLPDISLAAFKSDESLLDALTPEILDQTARLFGIRIEWLEGVDEHIYEFLGCGSDPKILLDHLASITSPGQARLSFPLRMVATSGQLDREDPRAPYLAPVLVETVAMLGETNVCRYHVYRDGFDWNHKKSRLELKAIAKIVYDRLRIAIPIFPIGERDMSDILEGRAIPHRLVSGCPITSPSLEDFILTPEESVVSKEFDELPDVLSYLDDINLSGYQFPEHVAEPPEMAAGETVAPSTSKAPAKGIGKRAQAEAEVWGPLQHAAQALWAEHGPIPIAEVVSRLQMMPLLKGAKLSRSAIHKRIAPFAPPEVRGKPGRKPKKPS
jgi:hypothetical protein